MKGLKILLMAWAFFYSTPAIASDVVFNVEDSTNPNLMKRTSSEERELFFRQKEASDDQEAVQTRRQPQKTCWQISRPWVITGGLITLVCVAPVGIIYLWSEACLNLLAHNGTSIFCANNSTNNTGGWMAPWGGIP